MKPIKIPFEIGLDYEIWEFDLEVLDHERIANYDSYLYVGEINKFLNFSTYQTELIFHWDILEMVVLTFLNINTTTLLNQLETFNFSSEIIKYKLIKYTRHREVIYMILLNSKETILIYGNPNKSKEILKVLDSILK
jgi:hypothetical protein